MRVAKSCIVFDKSITINTEHNDRTLAPSYLIGGNVECNRSAKEALQLKNQIIEDAKEAYFKWRGQKFKAKSYEWSAVVNLKPDSTMQDLENLANHFQNKYGFQCYQIAIHRDEGHIDDNGNKQINHHAHLEFITLDKDTGKSLQREITPKVLRQIQDENAQILQMERGTDKKDSKRKHLRGREYARMKQEEEANTKKLRDELAKKEAEIQVLEIENQKLKQRLEKFKSIDLYPFTNSKNQTRIKL